MLLSCSSVTQQNCLVGEVVRVIDDLDTVKRLQAGHGEWTDDMAPVSLPPLLPCLSHLPLGGTLVTPPSPHSGSGPHWESAEGFWRRERGCAGQWEAVDLQPLLPGGLEPGPQLSLSRAWLS